tara:strand:+ start:128 stop:394 length:267 start_codon:yes stop_codon:yes gene_type:complete
MKNYFFIFSLSLLIASIMYLFTKEDGLLDYFELQSEYENLQQENKRLTKQRQNLQTEEKLLINNDYYKQKHIRENGYLGSNEKTILIK